MLNTRFKVYNTVTGTCQGATTCGCRHPLLALTLLLSEQIVRYVTPATIALVGASNSQASVARTAGTFIVNFSS